MVLGVGNDVSRYQEVYSVARYVRSTYVTIGGVGMSIYIILGSIQKSVVDAKKFCSHCTSRWDRKKAPKE